MQIKPNFNQIKPNLHGRRHHDRMVVGFRTTCAISTYHL